MSTEASEEENIELITEENDDNYVNDDLYNISSWGADYSFRELVTLYDEGDLIKPELQRKYVWTNGEASRFIDSILLGLPVPSIFLAKQGDEKMLIIDGYQRLMTVRDFISGIWSTDNSEFRLSNTQGKVNARWRGKKFSELTDTEQRKIKTTTIHAIIFEQKQPKDDDTSLYQIFERINTSGTTLLPQEIRNCVYQGELNTLLFKLNVNEKWRLLFGNKKEDNRMRDMEYILRFLALKSDFPDISKKGNISLKKYLNEFMGNKENNMGQSLLQNEIIFNQCIDNIFELFGANVFYNLTNDFSSIRKRFYPTIFDSIMIATYIAIKDKGTISSTEDQRIALLKDHEYRKYISEGTMQTESINGRINLALKYLYGY